MDNFEFYGSLIDKYNDEKYNLLKAQTFNSKHFGFPPIYYKIMETDATRVGAFKKAFQVYNNLQDTVVCEAGVGTLALTKHYLPYVKKAYLIENNPNLREFIVQEIDNMGYTDKVEIIFGDAMTLELPEKVDYVIGELMSIYCANEFQVQIFKNLRKYLKSNGKLLPEKIINTAELVSVQFDEGINHYPLNFTRHLPEKLSLPQIVNVINLYTEERTDIQKDTEFQSLLEGEINGILMHSLVQVAPGANFTGTDSLMPPTVLKTKNSLHAKASDKVTLKSKFSYGTNLDIARFSVSKKEV